MGNSILYNTAGSIALAINYILQGPYSTKFLTRQGDTTVRINAEFFVRVDDAVICVDTDTDLTEADLDAGESFDASDTYYIYACHPAGGSAPEFKISKNATYPAGYTALISRKIGGFNTDGSGHIYEPALWDLRSIDYPNYEAITINGSAALTAEMCRGRIIYVTAAGTLTLPPVFSELLVAIVVPVAAVVHVDPDDADRIVLNGLALADGHKISSSGTAGSLIVLHADSAAGLSTLGRINTWVDGG